MFQLFYISAFLFLKFQIFGVEEKSESGKELLLVECTTFLFLVKIRDKSFNVLIFITLNPNKFSFLI